MAQPDLLTELARLPAHWHFVAVDGEKRPYQRQWERRPLDQAGMARQIASGKARGIGVQLGPASGLMAVDLDGPSAADELTRLGVPLLGLPMTWAVTSGRPGRQQLLFTVAPDRQDGLRPTKRYPVGPDGQRVIGDDGKAENLDLRWTGQQSIVAGAHPLTGAYRWVSGCSPADLPLAEAPDELLELMRRPADPEPQPVLPPPPTSGTVPLIDFITRDSRSLIETGGTPGAWNDDHLRLALDLQGTEAWLLAQGVRPDVTAEDLFRDHCSAAARLSPDFDRRKAMRRFTGAAKRNPRPGTPEAKLLDRLRYHTRSSEPAPSSPPDPPEPPEEPEHREPFVLLGFDGDAYYYQPHSTGQVMRLARSAHTSTNLVALAPLAYWEAIAPGKTGPNWTAVAARLFHLQAAVGVYQPARIRGRGAWWDQGQPVLHLGDRLIVAGETLPVSHQQPGSRALYQRLGALSGPGDAVPLDDQGCQMLAAFAERFRWEVPASGTLLAGWVALAPICGALPWRPHCWLTGAAGSGKSAILDRYVIPLLGDMGLVVLGNTTEPGIRQALRADALPVVFDEAEGNERQDQQRIQSILGLARVASSESAAQTLKGTPEGDAQRFVIRSMFLFSSIAHGLKQGADLSRFAQLTLRSPGDTPAEQLKAHWDQLSADLDLVTPAVGRALQARTLRLIPAIRESIGVLTRQAALAFNSQRLGDQYGTLLAGAWSLQSDQPITPQQAQQFIDQNDWEPYSQATEAPDEHRCLQRILQHQLRVEGLRTVTRTVGELVLIAAHRQPDIDVGPDLASATIERHGLRLDGAALVISNTAREVAAILADTAWVNCWATVLARLPGAERTGPTRFRGLGSVSRGTRLGLDALNL